MHEDAAHSEPMIDVRGLTKSYAGTTVVDEVTFQIAL